jgi:hypothetical protein
VRLPGQAFAHRDYPPSPIPILASSDRLSQCGFHPLHALSHTALTANLPPPPLLVQTKKELSPKEALASLERERQLVEEERELKKEFAEKREVSHAPPCQQ